MKYDEKAYEELFSFFLHSMSEISKVCERVQIHIVLSVRRVRGMKHVSLVKPDCTSECHFRSVCIFIIVHYILYVFSAVDLVVQKYRKNESILSAWIPTNNYCIFFEQVGRSIWERSMSLPTCLGTFYAIIFGQIYD